MLSTILEFFLFYICFTKNYNFFSLKQKNDVKIIKLKTFIFNIFLITNKY